MSAVRLLLVLFLVVPLAEIWVLIEVGSVVGAVATIGLVVLTAVVGAALMRAQGLATLFRARAAMAKGEVPALELLEGAVILIARRAPPHPGIHHRRGRLRLPSPVRPAAPHPRHRQPAAAGTRRPHGHPQHDGRTLEGSTGARRTGTVATIVAADSFQPLDLSEVAPIISTRFE